MILVFDTSNLSTDICKTIFVIGRLYWIRICYPHNHVVRIRNYPHHSLSARGTKNKVKIPLGDAVFFSIHTIFQYFGESFGISQ